MQKKSSDGSLVPSEPLEPASFGHLFPPAAPDEFDLFLAQQPDSSPQ